VSVADAARATRGARNGARGTRPAAASAAGRTPNRQPTSFKDPVAIMLYNASKVNAHAMAIVTVEFSGRTLKRIKEYYSEVRNEEDDDTEFSNIERKKSEPPPAGESDKEKRLRERAWAAVSD
ncbi:hypothetical protein HDU93_008565, partial [Gonapodya sp. JEL0774]